MADFSFWMPLLGILYILVIIGVVAMTLVAIWRGMKAHERIAAHLAGIERALVERNER